LGLIISVLLCTDLTACTPTGSFTFRNDKYGFTMKYPIAWKVNALRWAPPPPEGTYVSGHGNKLVVHITAWPNPDHLAQMDLRRQGWAESQVTVAGVPGRLFERPGVDRRAGVWKVLFFEKGGVAYELGLNVHATVLGAVGNRVFSEVIQSLTWD
jgi:hypothetical protein